MVNIRVNETKLWRTILETFSRHFFSDDQTIHNRRNYIVSSCECDKEFKNCLQKIGISESLFGSVITTQWMGNAWLKMERKYIYLEYQNSRIRWKFLSGIKWSKIRFRNIPNGTLFARYTQIKRGRNLMLVIQTTNFDYSD